MSQVRHLERLTVAGLSFRQAGALAESMSENKIKADAPLYSVQIAGIVVTYARNFVDAQEIGRLPPKYSEFEDQQLQSTHDLLVEARHKVYAHRDRPASKTFVYDVRGAADPYEVRIMFKSEGGLTVFPNLPDLHPSQLPDVARLCSFQFEKISVEQIAVIKSMMKEGHVYPADRIYTIGKDFP